MNTEKQNQTSRWLWIINALIIVAVIALFIMQFNDNDDNHDSVENQIQQPPIPTGVTAKMAFVNSDLILQKYELVTELAKQLESERKKKDDILKVRQTEFEQEAAYFQETVQKQSLSEASAQKIYEQLMEKQQAIYALQDQYANELAQKEFMINMTLLDSVRNYLHRMNVEYQFDYIMNYNETGGILLAKDTFDITSPVLKGLNDEYNAQLDPQ